MYVAPHENKNDVMFCCTKYVLQQVMKCSSSILYYNNSPRAAFLRRSSRGGRAALGHPSRVPDVSRGWHSSFTSQKCPVNPRTTNYCNEKGDRVICLRSVDPFRLLGVICFTKPDRPFVLFHFRNQTLIKYMRP
jgi:hypothetical protein